MKNNLEQLRGFLTNEGNRANLEKLAKAFEDQANSYNQELINSAGKVDDLNRGRIQALRNAARLVRGETLANKSTNK